MKKLMHVYNALYPSFCKLFIISLLAFLFSACFTSSTYAAGATKVKKFSVSGWSQGAVLTPQYYVFTEWNGSSFKVTRCNRPNGKGCKSSGTYSGKPSSMYYSWGSNYAQAIKKENSGMVCINLSTMKEESGKCGSMVKSSGLSKSGDTQGYRQGWTKYGSYYLRGYGINNGMTNYIWLFNSKKSIVKSWAIPTSGEVEDVMVEGDTGIVWFTMYQSSGTITYYKADQSAFSKWIQAGAAGDSGVAAGGTYVDPTSNPDDYYDDSDMEVRDETKQHETVNSSYDGSVDTNFFGPLQDDNEGCGVYMVLNTIIEFLTYGIAIAATIGIAISGFIYLNAKGNQQQTLKAKRRIYEIVIGLAAYAVLYFALGFLLPGGNFNPDKTCARASETSNAVAGWSPDTGSGSSSSSSSGKKSKAQITKEKNDDIKQAAEDAKNGTSAAGRKLMDEAVVLAGKLEANKFVYSKKNQPTYAKALKKDKHVDCAKYVSWAMQAAGLLPSGKTFYLQNGVIKGSGKAAVTKNSKLKITKVNDTVANLVKKGKLVPGDIIGPNYLHTLIYQGIRDGKYYYYSVGTSTTKNKIMNKKKITNKTYGKNGKYKIKIIIHPI